MELILQSREKPRTTEIFVKKTENKFKHSDFGQTLLLSEQGNPSIVEKGQITSLSQHIDLTLYKDIMPHGAIPWDLYQLIYERNSLVFNAVNNTADFAIQAGFDLEGSTDAKKKIFDWFDKVNFELILVNIFKQLQIYGNAYLDISNMSFPKLLPPKSMFVRVQKGGDNDGEILGYAQFLDGGITKIDMDKKDIIHFKNNDCTNSFYGMSELKPVLGSLTRYVNWTEDLGEILHRFAAPYLHHKVGTPEFPASETQISNYTASVNNRLPGEDMVTSGAIEIEVIQGTKGMIQMDNLVKALQDEIIAGLRIPEIFARGGVSANKAVGDVEMQAFDRKTRALQTVAAVPVEDFLFPRLTSGKVKLKWNEFSAEGEKVRAERLQLMVSAGVPITVALQMVGWSTWIDDVEKEMEKNPPESQDKEFKPFKPEEKETEEMFISAVKIQKSAYRNPSEEKIEYISDLAKQKEIFRNPKVKKDGS